MYIIHKYTFTFWLSYFKYESQNRPKIVISVFVLDRKRNKKARKSARSAEDSQKLCERSPIRPQKNNEIQIRKTENQWKNRKKLEKLGSNREKMQKLAKKSQNPIHLWGFVYVS